MKNITSSRTGIGMAKFFLILGVVFIFIGLVYPYLVNLGFGRLPGDIVIERKNYNFYFPITTSIIISIVLSILFKVFLK